MTATSKLGLELLQNAAANQTLANTTFAQLNQLVQPAVVDKDLAVPPSSPTDEALYIVAASPSGAWAGKAGQLAYWLNATGVWQFVPPQNGFMVKVLDESKRYEFNGTTWVEFSTGGGGASLATTGGTMTGAILGPPLASVASGSFPDLSAANSNQVTITGTSTITGFELGAGAVSAGSTWTVTFAASLTLTHNAANGYHLLNLTGADILTRVGDVAVFQKTGAGNEAKMLAYSRYDGSALNDAAITSVISASTPDIATGAPNTLNITGTTAITGFATAPSGIKRTLITADVLTLTHNATSLILLGNANVVTAAGDIAEFLSLGSGNWKMTRYTRAAVAP